MNFEERYEDVLQNLEFAIVQAYREHPELYDAQVENALGWVLRAYAAEERGKPAPAALPGLGGEVAARVLQMCEWRLGRTAPGSEAGPVTGGTSLTRGEIVDCLKRIRRSVGFWTKKGGRQGYLEFVNGFLL